MDGSIKKCAAWGLLVLLLGAAPALACERDLPHRHEWPGGVSEPRHLAPGALRYQLQILLANREQWDRVPQWDGLVNIAVLDMDWNGELEILVNAEGEGRNQGYEVQPETGKLKKIPEQQLYRSLNNLLRAPAWFTIMPEKRQDWLQKDPAQVIHMLRDSYENYAGLKEGFG